MILGKSIEIKGPTLSHPSSYPEIAWLVGNRGFTYPILKLSIPPNLRPPRSLWTSAHLNWRSSHGLNLSISLWEKPPLASWRVLRMGSYSYPSSQLPTLGKEFTAFYRRVNETSYARAREGDRSPFIHFGRHSWLLWGVMSRQRPELGQKKCRRPGKKEFLLERTTLKNSSSLLDPCNKE